MASLDPQINLPTFSYPQAILQQTRFMGLKLMITSCFSLNHKEQNLIIALPWIWMLIICQHSECFPGGSEGNAGDTGSVPGLGRSPGEGMATHSGTLAWKISWTEKPCRLQSRGSQRVRQDWATSLSIFQTKDTFQEFRTMEQDVYWKQEWDLRVLHWLPSNLYL